MSESTWRLSVGAIVMTTGSLAKRYVANGCSFVAASHHVTATCGACNLRAVMQRFTRLSTQVTSVRLPFPVFRPTGYLRCAIDHLSFFSCCGLTTGFTLSQGNCEWLIFGLFKSFFVDTPFTFRVHSFCINVTFCDFSLHVYDIREGGQTLWAFWCIFATCHN